MSLLIDDCMRRNALVYADRIAALSPEQNWTWAELHAEIQCFADVLVQQGIGAGDRVLLVQENSVYYLICNFAVWSLGAAVVTASAKLTVSEIEFIVRDCSPVVALVSADCERTVSEAAERIDSPATVQTIAAMRAAAADVPQRPLVTRKQAERDEHDIAVIGYTSGTTGQPKGAVLTHRNMLASATSVAIERSLTPYDRYLFLTPMNHISALSFCAMTTLVGASFMVPEKFAPDRFVDLVREQPITYCFLVPTMMHMILNDLDRRGDDKLNAQALRLICYGAAPIVPDLLRRALDRFQCGFSQAYGMTEASPVVSILPPVDHEQALNGTFPERLDSAGRATLHARIRVVDENGRDCDSGEVGEIVLAGPSIMQGYWNRPDVTDRVLKDGWFYSGDLGYLDRYGYLYVVGRRNDMIISGGINVYPREVELVISGCPGVAEAAVVGVPDAKWGEAVTAFIAPLSGVELVEQEVADYCSERLAAYKKPKRIILVEALPRNATGKVLKRRLRDNL